MGLGLGIAESGLLFATPLLIAALGELIVERAGVVNIAIEGIMLAAALAAWVGHGFFGPVWGLGAGVGMALLMGLMFAAITVGLNADQIVTGTGLNLLALGGTAMAYRAIEQHLKDRGMEAPRFSGASPWWMTAATGVLAVGLWLFFAKTRTGMELTAIGHAPKAARSAGIGVGRRQLLAILAGAGCAGLAGCYLSTMRVQQFEANMTEGQGFLALAIVIFGRWNAIGIVVAGLLFGMLRAALKAWQIRGGAGDAAAQLVEVMPYVLSLVVLAALAGRWGAPVSLGKPLARE